MLIDEKLLRLTILQTASASRGAAHIGGALSSIDILNVLFGKIMEHDPCNPLDPKRDRFILSKGHSFLSLLAVLFHHGYFSEDDLSGFQVDEGAFISHPVKDLPRGVESSNGSLGQGLSYGLGLAQGMRALDLKSKVFVLMGDSECSEGSVWEAAILAGKVSAGNLTAIVDANGFGNDGYGPILDAAELAGMFKVLGWDVSTVDGHDVFALERALASKNLSGERPVAVVCETVKGKGVSFMEANNDWHHGRLSPRLLNQAMVELGFRDVE